LLTPRPTPKLEDHPLSAGRECLFNIFAVTLHIGGRSSNRNLRTSYAVVTGNHLSRADTSPYMWSIIVKQHNKVCNTAYRHLLSKHATKQHDNVTNKRFHVTITMLHI